MKTLQRLLTNKPMTEYLTNKLEGDWDITVRGQGWLEFYYQKKLAFRANEDVYVFDYFLYERIMYFICKYERGEGE